jgi:hypothetical protein
MGMVGIDASSKRSGRAAVAPSVQCGTEVGMNEFEFVEKSIGDLSKGMPIAILSADAVERIRNQLHGLNRDFGLFPEEKVASIIDLTSRYVKHTSPERTSEDVVDAMAAYLFFWFWINTQKNSALLARVVRDFPEIMQGGAGAVPEVSPYLQRLSKYWGYRRGIHRFLSDFETMVCAMVWELENWNRYDYPVEYYDQLRVHSIGTQPWFDGWRLLAGLASPVENGTEVRRLEYLCRRIQYLANDLCSVERDLERGGSSSVLLFHRGQDIPLADSIVKVEVLHDQTVEEAIGIWRRLMASAMSEQDKWYTHFLMTCTAGNANGMAEIGWYYRRVALPS